MSKERLEVIKRFFDEFVFPVGRQQPTRKYMSALFAHESVNWLIQQAEEKIELEERFETLSDIHDRTVEENQRYKQALEFYADPENHDREVDYGKDSGLKKSNVDIDRGYKARQAIKGGNDNE